MKVHLIRKETIRKFIEENGRSRSSFELWLTAIKFADWTIPADIKKTFGAADVLGKGCSRVVFDIAGNAYRMICKYAFGEFQVHLFICWIGTHAEYSALCRKGDQYTVNQY